MNDNVSDGLTLVKLETETQPAQSAAPPYSIPPKAYQQEISGLRRHDNAAFQLGISD